MPLVTALVETIFNCPLVKATVPRTSAYAVPVAELAWVMVPPLEVIPIAATRSKAPSVLLALVSVMPPPLRVMPVVSRSAWLLAAKDRVIPALIVVLPVQPLVEVPLSVSVPAVKGFNAARTTLPEPATVSVMVAAAMALKRMLLVPAAKVSVFAPVLMV